MRKVRNVKTHIVLLQDLGDTPKYPLSVEVQTQLPDDQAASVFQ
jgi:hypothetical protein